MNISTSPYDYNYHYSQVAGNQIYGKYVRHIIDVFNTITIEGLELSAVYQTGNSFDHNDYNCPNAELALSEDGGTSEVLVKVNRINESDFENEEFIFETLEEVKELCPCIDSVEKLKAVYNALNDNRPSLSEFLAPDKYTDNFDDYIYKSDEDEESGILTLKS